MEPGVLVWSRPLCTNSDFHNYHKVSHTLQDKVNKIYCGRKNTVEAVVCCTFILQQYLVSVKNIARFNAAGLKGSGTKSYHVNIPAYSGLIIKWP